MALRGRFSIFGDKSTGRDIHGIISYMGAIAFKRAEKRLSAVYEDVMGRKPASVSEADVVEYLARGEAETRLALNKLKEKLHG